MRSLILALLLPIAAQAAIVRVGHAFTQGTSLATSATRTYAPTTGNTVFVGITTWTTGTQPTTPTLSDGGTNTYSLVPPNGGSANPQYDGSRSDAYIYRSSNVVGGSFTYTFTIINVAFINIFVVEYSGLANVSQGDGFVSAAGAAPTVSSGSLTTTHAADLLFSTLSESESSIVTSFAATGGWAIIDQTNTAGAGVNGAVMEQIVASTGTYAATATFTGSTSDYAATLAATKGAGSPSVPRHH